MSPVAPVGCSVRQEDSFSFITIHTTPSASVRNDRGPLLSARVRASVYTMYICRAGGAVQGPRRLARVKWGNVRSFRGSTRKSNSIVMATIRKSPKPAFVFYIGISGCVRYVVCLPVHTRLWYLRRCLLCDLSERCQHRGLRNLDARASWGCRSGIFRFMILRGIRLFRRKLLNA